MSRRLAGSVRVVNEDGVSVMLAAGEELPAWAESQVTNKAAFEPEEDDDAPADGKSPEDAAAEAGVQAPEEPAGEPAGPDYSSMTVSDLRAEIDRRNEGRAEEDLIPADGLKADLVAALEADDGN